MEKRPPVVAVLGHIDHGKSTLLDYIRKTSVVENEAGGITQHASAYEIVRALKDNKSEKITFIDTPGHEAFSSTRVRCVNVADIAALVVSAEDGVKPQTLEALAQIKDCSLPYLVLISKTDKPTANIERTKQNLAENEIYVEGYGGNIPVIEISAKTGKGVEEFLDMVSLMAELESKEGNREALGSGVIIESRMDPKSGIVAVGIIKDGTIRKGLFAATRAGQTTSSGAIAPIRFMLDADGKMVEELSFSSPVQVTGWDKLPAIGADFKTFLKKEDAQAFSETKKAGEKEKKLERKTDDNIAYLPLIVKADTAGSLEAITEKLEKLASERMVAKVILSGVGSINENDIKSALTTAGSIVVGFNVKADQQATLLAKRSGIEILLFDIIYELTDKISKLLLERTPKIEMEEITGSVKVLKIFSTVKDKQVLGGRVLTGTLKSGIIIKIVRRDVEIGTGKVKELQQAKIATDSVKEGTEFGAMIESKIEIAPGDVLNAVTIVIK